VVTIQLTRIGVKKKYNESYIQYRFTSINLNEEEKPQCVIYSSFIERFYETHEVKIIFGKCSSLTQR